MYNLLVVDDEDIAIRGIVEGIDWSSLPLANIFTAYDAEEARQVFRGYPIHVLISDIDIPQENGIHLLTWVNETSPQTETIFLTGHANFNFAQQAVQLGSFDYLLKPVDHDVLKSCVEKAIEAVRLRQQEEAYLKTYAYYFDQWNRQLPLLVERLWQDVLGLRIPASADKLEPLFELYGIPLDIGKRVQPLLISVEQWTQEWNARDEEIMTYALKNAAADILLRDRSGHVIQDAGGILFALLYEPSEEDESTLEERCTEYIRKCSEYLYAVVSCYIGEAAPVASLRLGAQSLGELERSNVCQTGRVFRLSDFKREKKSITAQPNLQDWSALIEQGKTCELKRHIEDLFDRLQLDQVGHAYMVSYYFGLVHTVFQVLQRRSVPVETVYADEEWHSGEHAMKSLGAMKTWTIQFAAKASDCLVKQGKDVSNTIAKVQTYIEDNLQHDLNREEIARHVYLNPAYLSRLFRKETGKSLTDYMVDRRMLRSISELKLTNHKISDIAISVGYASFSHFSKQFKRSTGMTPQDYRKKYQNIR
ncbi:two-component system response regulator YesN [Paenibacillus sp. BK033]|uniref:response regulator transcription factor n=1 Tax=Paenibacillus sp. BK033 TaxID=2512133 RepID=UPI00104E5B08|nr:helix-turn-helix domain-containing protein [Paenibacillus sp. BK033]TCM97850.1 two-component system response regulator YesN [Paenibacillus sp. BK033]